MNISTNVRQSDQSLVQMIFHLVWYFSERGFGKDDLQGGGVEFELMVNNIVMVKYLLRRETKYKVQSSTSKSPKSKSSVQSPVRVQSPVYKVQCTKSSTCTKSSLQSPVYKVPFTVQCNIIVRPKAQLGRALFYLSLPLLPRKRKLQFKIIFHKKKCRRRRTCSIKFNTITNIRTPRKK